MEGIADYSFVRLLGSGNHGSFYLARRPPRLPLNAEYVAVKVVSGATSAEAFRRATRELRAFAAVRSSYLVKLYDAGQQGQTFFYAMEYLPMGSLASPATPLARAQGAQAVADAARAAHDLHEVGIVHRDIKPANVLLRDGGGVLSDLGLAQVLAPGITVTGMGTIGSIEYLDPVIVRGGRPSRSSDIWSLGVTLHRALAGCGLYGELPQHDPVMALRLVLAQSPQISDRLGPEAADLVRACLAPDPGDRPADARDLAASIDHLAQMEST